MIRKNTQAQFYCGTSNIVLPVPNKAHYPPQYRDKSRLHYYASIFNSVEINSSFYKLPMPATVARWAGDVPAGFRFSFKMWGAITHAKELSYNVADIHKFLQVVSNAGDKKGCLLIQFPASIKVSYFQKLKNLLNDISSCPEVSGWKLAVEFRDRSWYRDTVYELLDNHGTAVVVHDMPASATSPADMDTQLVYLRFHGEHGKYRGSYDRDQLQEYAANIKDWLAEGRPVFAYFNNTMGDAVHNAIALKKLL